jgi:phosphatidylinositol 3-kinase
LLVLLGEDGKLFHIDFGFVLGRDPKPQFTTPHMRITREMVESMRLPETEQLTLLNDFKKYCVDAFCALRQYANPILLMLFLMSDCGLSQITAMNVRNARNNFALHLEQEELEGYMLGKVGESLNMVFPKINDQLHKIAQTLRS